MEIEEQMEIDVSTVRQGKKCPKNSKNSTYHAKINEENFTFATIDLCGPGHSSKLRYSRTIHNEQNSFRSGTRNKLTAQASLFVLDFLL